MDCGLVTWLRRTFSGLLFRPLHLGSTMKNTKLLTFVNHASFYVTTGESLLLVDPWVEGAVFNNGWSLLDTSTSNAALVKEIADHHRHTFIWISQERPDHFSAPFLRRLKQDFRGKLTFLFQRTKDKRGVSLLRRSGFDVLECMPGRPVRLDPDMAITVWPYSDGDSYCLIRCGERHILNLNDCAIASAEACRTVRATLPPATAIDVLLTQFGYDHWIGNPFEASLRRAAAADKLQRLQLQIATFAPFLTVPFASFFSFASSENHYLNDCQNTAAGIARWAARCHTTNCVRFLKPGGRIDLDHDTPGSLRASSDAAVAHWTRVDANAGELLPAEPAATAQQVRAAFVKHRSAIASKLLFLPWLLERVRLIAPLTIYLPDLALRIRVSYLAPYRELEADGPYDISMTSPSAVFLFNNEFGFTTTRANGRFRSADDAALLRFTRFFMPQNLWRQGYGIDHPGATIGYLVGNLLGRAQRTVAGMQRRLSAPKPK